jgi:single-strand DNA-binding protein
MAGITYEMTGSVKVIFEPMVFPSGFTKREFVLTMDDDYPQDIKFACIKEKCSLLDNIAVGERVKVNFRIRGNLFKERYFVDLQAFRIDKLEADGSSISYDEGIDVPLDDPPLPF